METPCGPDVGTFRASTPGKVFAAHRPTSFLVLLAPQPCASNTPPHISTTPSLEEDGTLVPVTTEPSDTHHSTEPTFAGVTQVSETDRRYPLRITKPPECYQAVCVFAQRY